MAIQLGFNSDVRITSWCDADEAINILRERYLDYTTAIDGDESDARVRSRIIFAILSVHSPIHATFASYRKLSLALASSRRPLGLDKIRWAIDVHASDGVVQYIPTKAHYIRDFLDAWRVDKSRFTRNGESDNKWRLRIQKNVRGLGLAKASFAVALCRPTKSTVCCVDTHIFRLFTGLTPNGSIRITDKAYLAIEAKIRRLARRHHLSCFACQWLLWDAKRGVSEPHSVLAA